MKPPKVYISISTTQDAIQQVTLKPASVFSYEILTPCSTELKMCIDEWVAQYLKGEDPKIILPYLLPSAAPFTLKIWDLISKIPRGEIISYQELADKAGSPRAFRAAGTVCGRNPIPFFIPCHRVLAQNRKIGGYTGGTELKREILAFEGI